MLEVYIDGCCEPNPGGTASYGVVVLRKPFIAEPAQTYYKVYGGKKIDKNTIVWEDCKVIGSGPEMSNNVAEYAGLVAFLEWYKEKQLSEGVVIYSDSQLLVQQMKDNWKVRKGLYVPYYEKATSLAFQIEGIGRKLFGFKWIPREENLADELSVKALAEIGILRRK